jgi:hypothetical protein
MARASVAVYNANGKNGIDTREISQLEHSLYGASDSIQRKAPAVIKKGAVNIKKDARDAISSARAVRTTIPAYPYAIGFSIRGYSGTEAEIGPSRRRGKQGKLGNLLEYGGMFNAPIPHLQPALEREAPNVARHLLSEGANIL